MFSRRAAATRNVLICAVIVAYAATIIFLMARHALAGEIEVTITCKKQVCEMPGNEMTALINHYLFASKKLNKKCGGDTHATLLPRRSCEKKICIIDREDIKSLIERNNDVTAQLDRAMSATGCGMGRT